MNIQDILQQLMLYQPDKVILFGSQAYGQPTEESDFDIAIIKETNDPFHKRLIDVRRLVRTTQPIDFFVFTREEVEREKIRNPLIAEIMDKGRLVYQAHG